MDLSATASIVFVEYILPVKKCLNAFLKRLCYFVHFGEE